MPHPYYSPLLSLRLMLLGTLAMLSAGQGQALTVGVPSVRSSLGQPLDVRLPYALDDTESMDDRCVRLIPPAAEQAEVLRGGVVSAAPPGARRGELRIQSRQSVNEPVLLLALQFNCGGRGQFTREFSVLLDPAPLVASPVVAAPVASPPAPVRVKPAKRARAPARPPVVVAPAPTRAPKATAPTPTPAPALPPPNSGKLSVTVDNGAAPAAPPQAPAATSSSAEAQRLAEVAALQTKIRDLQTEMAQLRAQRAPQAIAPPPVKPAVPPAGQGDWVATAATVLAVLGALMILGSVGWWTWMRRRPEPAPRWNVPPSPSPSTAGLTAAPSVAASPRPARVEPAVEPASPARPVATAPSPMPMPPPQASRDNAIVVEDNDRWVLEEAQVFLSHGWVDHAVSLLSEEVDRHPFHLDVWLMLFEVYRQYRMNDAFRAAAIRFQEVAADLPVWSAVCKMGLELDPHDPLFGGTPRVAAEPPADEPEVPQLPETAPEPPKPATPQMGAPAGPSSPPLAPPLDFDLTPMDEPPERPAEASAHRDEHKPGA